MFTISLYGTIDIVGRWNPVLRYHSWRILTSSSRFYEYFVDRSGRWNVDCSLFSMISLWLLLSYTVDYFRLKKKLKMENKMINIV